MHENFKNANIVTFKCFIVDSHSHTESKIHIKRIDWSAFVRFRLRIQTHFRSNIFAPTLGYIHTLLDTGTLFVWQCNGQLFFYLIHAFVQVEIGHASVFDDAECIWRQMLENGSFAINVALRLKFGHVKDENEDNLLLFFASYFLDALSQRK